MVDGVRYASVLGHGLVGEVDLAVLVYRNVFQQGVATDGVVDVRFGFLVQVDDLGIAAAFEVEHTFVVPAVFVVADQQTFRIGGQGRFTRAGESEEDGSVLAVHVRIGRAVHRSHTLERKQVVHVGEDTFLHLSAVPRVEDHLLFFRQVEYHGRFGVQAQFLVVYHLGFGCVEGYEIRFAVVGQFFFGRTDEHVLDKVSLPSHLHDEAHLDAGVFVRSAEGIHHVEVFVGKFLDGQFLQHVPRLGRNGLVVVLVTFRGPPDRVAGGVVQYEKFILGRAAGVDTGHHVYCSQFGYLPFFIALQAGVGFCFEKLFVRGVVIDFLHARDPVLGKIQISHFVLRFLIDYFDLIFFVRL